MNLSLLITVAAILATGFFPHTDANVSLAFLPLLIGGIASLASAGIGAMSKASAEERAAAKEAQALKQWMDLNIPDPKQQEIYLKKLRSEGRLSPVLEGVITQKESEMNSISTDPRLKDAQLKALSSLEGISEAGGANLTDKANLAQIQSDNAAAERGSREAIMQNMRARGASGSGLELAAALDNQQAAATRNSQQGLSIAAQQQQRALEAIMNAGKLGGDMQNQEFGQKAQIATAQDAINRFNASNSQDVLQRNTAAKNFANQYNLTNDQRISDTNVGLSNQQEIHNKGLAQQQFDNQVQKTAGATGQLNSAAKSDRQSGNESAAMWGGVGQSIMSAGTALSQEEAKKKKKAEEGF